MIRKLTLFSLVLLIFFLYGLYVSQVEVTVISSQVQSHPSPYYDYKGLINVQSDLSKGSSSPREIIEEAKNTDTDFIVFTDQDFEGSDSHRDSYSESILSLYRREHNFLDSRILLIDDHDLLKSVDHLSLQMRLTDLLSQKVSDSTDEIRILAHPFLKGRPTWTGDFPPGISGIEVLNPKAMSENVYTRSPMSVIWSLLMYPFNWRYSFLRLFQEPNLEILLWDQVNINRPLYGYAGSNATARAIILPSWLIQFPSYQKSFDLLGNHILLSSELTGNVEKDRTKIIQALKLGHFYFSLDLLASPRGFNTVLQSGEKTHLMGSTVVFKSNQKIIATLPAKPNCFFEIVLFRNGKRVHTSNDQTLIYDVKKPGAYRILVRVIPQLPLPDAKVWLTWIYSNPFFITGSGFEKETSDTE